MKRMILLTMLLAAATPSLAQTFYLGQILTFPYNFCPANTLPTNGELLPITQYTALFALLGTSYGGNGTTTFALPNIKAPLSANRSPLISCIAISGVFPSRD